MNFYTSSEYLKKNPTYHSEDSLYKYNNFVKILKKNNLNFKKLKKIIDVGCGIGEILKYLKKNKLFFKSKFIGYDINKYAIKIAKKNSNILFFCKNYIKSTKNKKSDLIICADVFEHIDDEVYFLKKLLERSKYFLFNIPLDMSFISLIRKKFFTKKFNDVGHIHFYSKYSILLKIEYCGFKIVDKIYAKNRLEHFSIKEFSIKKFLIIPFQYLLDKINEDLACAIFGGYSLVVLAKNSKYK
jgi:2-polyprenyl-3-methyl-5-hydroxy-6-metoxy-1,4-benzoquinol methylase